MDAPLSTPIDRRQFLGGALTVGAVGATQHVLRGSGLSSMLRPRAATTVTSTANDRILIVCTLYGGMDGLEAVVPYQNSAYYQARGTIAVPDTSVLPIGEGFGLHPTLTNTKSLWDAGRVAIVQGVGYPNPDYSHFTSMDIWQSGSPSGDLTTGWIGRWLDRTGKDPMRALWLGSNLPLAFIGSHQQSSAIVATSSPTAQLPPGDPVFRATYAELEQHRAGQSPLETDAVHSASHMLGVGATVAGILTQVPAPTKIFGTGAGSLGTQLEVVSQLITGGARTRVYGVNLNGFDSHAGEIASYGTLLAQFDAAVGGFFNSIQTLPVASEVVMLVYTEFGRRVISNASLGTDHGSGNVAFLIGQPVVGGFYGEPPSLTQLDSNGSLIVTTDFRSIYSTLLDQVLDIDPVTILKSSLPPLSFLT